METLTRGEAETCFDELQGWRRYFHRHPELGFEEFETARIVAGELRKYGLQVEEQVGRTGVVGILDGGRPGRTILLQFDMDALPIQEMNEVEYRSETAGKMHACGHDSHMAVGLVCARILSQRKDQLAGRVKFVFQPAEEGRGGAEAMVADGVLENPRPDYSLAMHVWAETGYGTILLHPGPFMAASDRVEITILGRGGHGAMPHKAVDPVVAAAAVITNLQSIVARNVSPLEQAVVSITQVSGGETWNVIPDRVELYGSMRTFIEPVREMVMKRIRTVAEDTASALGCRPEVRIIPVTPAVVNDAGLVARLDGICRRVLPDCTIDTSYQTLASDDMAMFMQDIPGCYVMVGAKTAEGCGHHHPRFEIEEQAMVQGVLILVNGVGELGDR